MVQMGIYDEKCIDIVVGGCATERRLVIRSRNTGWVEQPNLRAVQESVQGPMGPPLYEP